MTRMAAQAYRMADAIRAAGAKVVMGGPHVTEVPDEPIGRTEEPRHADAVALGRGRLHLASNRAGRRARRAERIYRPVDEAGSEVKPSLEDYPCIPWERVDLEHSTSSRRFPLGALPYRSATPGLKSFRVVPIESGRGCPYGCDFCTVTGFSATRSAIAVIRAWSTRCCD